MAVLGQCELWHEDIRRTEEGQVALTYREQALSVLETTRGQAMDIDYHHCTYDPGSNRGQQVLEVRLLRYQPVHDVGYHHKLES